jgi:hypothetical protein
MGVYKDPHKFEKELAKINAQLTIVTTASSVFAVFGVSLFILGVTTGLEALSKTGEEITIFTIIGSTYSKFGVFIFFIGISVLVISQYLIPRKINKL